MRLLITNFDDETRVFDTDNEGNEMTNFLRTTVLNWVMTSEELVVKVPNGNFVVDEDSPEPMIWLAAAIIYMKCVESGDWGDILTVEKIGEED